MFGSRGYRPFGHSLTAKKLLGLAVISFVVLLSFFIQPSFTFRETIQYSSLSPQTDFSPQIQSCSPQAYAAGSWSYRPRTTAENMTSPEDALTFSGFEKCASSREYFWHLASDRVDQWDRFPGAQSWEWLPGEECKGMSPLTPEDLLRTLVEDGGWYLVGGKCII